MTTDIEHSRITRRRCIHQWHLWLFVITLSFGGIAGGAILGYQGYLALRFAFVRQEAECKVTNVSVLERSGDVTWYAIHVLGDLNVQSAKYLISGDIEQCNTRQEADARLSAYPPGFSVPCWYDPDMPENNSVEAPRFEEGIVFVLGAAIFLISAFIGFLCLFSKIKLPDRRSA